MPQLGYASVAVMDFLLVCRPSLIFGLFFGVFYVTAFRFRRSFCLIVRLLFVALNLSVGQWRDRIAALDASDRQFNLVLQMTSK
jgi:hypothetical protein